MEKHVAKKPRQNGRRMPKWQMPKWQGKMQPCCKMRRSNVYAKDETPQPRGGRVSKTLEKILSI